MLPSEIPKLPTDPPVRGFPGVWKPLLLLLPPQDRSPSLTLLSLFLSLIFCPFSFWRQWAAFLGAWCPLPAFRSCLWYLLNIQVFFRWICGGEIDLPVLFLHHLRTTPILPFLFPVLFTRPNSSASNMYPAYYMLLSNLFSSFHTFCFCLLDPASLIIAAVPLFAFLLSVLFPVNEFDWS